MFESEKLTPYTLPMLSAPIRLLFGNKYCFFLIMFLLILGQATAQLRQIYTEVNADNYIAKLSFYAPNEGYVAFRNFLGYTTDSGSTYKRKTISINNEKFNGYYDNLTLKFGLSALHA